MSEERGGLQLTSRFTERLSWFMAITAAIGGIYVILDPIIVVNVAWGSLKIGGEGFSEQLKGAVVALILVEGWKAVKEYWLGSSAGGQKQAESVAKIAENAAPTQALAVAAARSEPISTATKDTPTPVEIVGGAGVEDPLKVTKAQPKGD